MEFRHELLSNNQHRFAPETSQWALPGCALSCRTDQTDQTMDQCGKTAPPHLRHLPCTRCRSHPERFLRHWPRNNDEAKCEYGIICDLEQTVQSKHDDTQKRANGAHTGASHALSRAPAQVASSRGPFLRLFFAVLLSMTATKRRDMLTGRGHSWRGFPSFYGVRALLPPPYRHSLPWRLVAPSTIPPGKTEKRKKSILRLCCGKGCRNRSSPTRSPLPLRPRTEGTSPLRW